MTILLHSRDDIVCISVITDIRYAHEALAGKNSRLQAQGGSPKLFYQLEFMFAIYATRF